ATGCVVGDRLGLRRRSFSEFLKRYRLLVKSFMTRKFAPESWCWRYWGTTGAAYCAQRVQVSQLSDFTRPSGLPVVMVLRDGVVVSAFKPIPDDDNHSRTFYRSIRDRFIGR